MPLAELLSNALCEAHEVQLCLGWSATPKGQGRSGMSGILPSGVFKIMYEVVVEDELLDQIATILGIPEEKFPGLRSGFPREFRLMSKSHFRQVSKKKVPKISKRKSTKEK